jgi:hypothetical protein
VASLVLLALVVTAPLLGQTAADEVVVHVYAMRHQSAGDALAVVEPLMSPSGRYEVNKRDNTLVLHDSEATIARILPVLVAFDHPVQPLEVEIWVTRASGSRISPPIAPQAKGIPPDLVRSLTENLPYQDYALVGTSRVRAEEGEQMTFQLSDYTVRFRLGTIHGELGANHGDQRLRLEGFEVLLDSGDGTVQLYKSRITPWLGKPHAVVISPGGPKAVVVVVRCRTPNRVIAQPTPRPRASPRGASPTGGGHR